MNKFMQQTQTLFTKIICTMIMSTLVLLPFPTNLNLAYGADDEVSQESACEENINEDGSAGIYKVGCKFNEDLAKSKIKDHYPEGMAGIIEQFIGATFAMIGVSLFFTPIPKHIAMCPSNIGAKLTFPIVQAGSLSYLLGELAANAEFRKASKIAVDSTFAMKKDELDDDKDLAQENKESNNKQLEAYGALMDIYDAQVSGLEKKVMMATLAEGAFLTATGIEAKNILNMNSVYLNSDLSGTAKAKALYTSLSTNVGTLSAQAATYAAVLPPGSMATQAAACTAAATALSSYLGLSSSQVAQITASISAEKSAKLATTEAQSTGIIGFFSTIISNIKTGLLSMAPPQADAEVAMDNAQATTNDAKDIAFKSARAPLVSTITTQATTCSSPAGASAIEAITSLELLNTLPVYCGGVQTHKGATRDSSFGPLATNYEVADHSTISQIASSTPLKDNKQYVKAIIENTLRRIVMHRMNNETLTHPQTRLKKIATNELYIQRVMEQQDKIIDDNYIQKKFEQLQREHGIGSEQSQNYLLSMIESLKSEILIKSAHASAFKELLNIGVKVGLLYYSLNSWMKENAFPKPKSRLWTWGIMSGVNAAVIAFDSKSKKEAKSRYDIVVKEAQRFADSHSLRTKISGAVSGTGSKLNLVKSSRTAALQSQAGIQTCATAKGNTFVPSVCPSILKKQTFTFPVDKRVVGSSSSPTMKALGNISSGVYSAASTGLQGDTSTVSAAVGGLGSLNNALKTNNANLIKSLENDVFSNSNTQNKAEPNKLSASLVKFKKAFSGNPQSSGILTSDLDSGNSSLSGKLEKLEKSSTASIKSSAGGLNKVSVPSTPTFDFNIDGGTESLDSVEPQRTASLSKEESLSDFQINNAEINENKDVNIFKQISNRYLRSYPVLLEEK